MIELASSPPSYSARMWVQSGFMIILTALIVITISLIYTAPLSDGSPAPSVAEIIAKVWATKPWALLVMSVALLLIPLIAGWGKCRFRIEPDRLTMISNMPQPFKSGLTDWSVRRDEIRSIELHAVGAQFSIWLITASGTKRFALDPWFRLDRSVESQEQPFRLVLRAARLHERARASSLVGALEESGYAVGYPADEQRVDGFAQAKSGRAVATIAISAALLAVAEILFQSHAYLGSPPWAAIAGSGSVAAALAYGVLKNVEDIQAMEKMAAPLVLGACIALLMWAGAPRINAATADTDVAWIYVYEGDGVFTARIPGPPPLDFEWAHARAASAGWRRGDTLAVPVVRGALGFWQYDRRETYRRVREGERAP